MADRSADQVAVRLRLIGPEPTHGTWRALGTPATSTGAESSRSAPTSTVGDTAGAAVSALRRELERPGVRVAFWMPATPAGADPAGSPDSTAPPVGADTVRVAARLHSPGTVQGSGQWAAVTLGWAEALTVSPRLTSTVDIGLAGLFAWGDEPADAVRALGSVVLESARGRLRSSWQDWTAVVVFVPGVVEPTALVGPS